MNTTKTNKCINKNRSQNLTFHLQMVIKNTLWTEVGRVWSSACSPNIYAVFNYGFLPLSKHL